MRLDKSLVYKRAWHRHKLQLKFKGKTSLGYHLKQAYKLAKYVGYDNYKPSAFEINYLNF
jgi:hypothetical protein